MSGGGLCLGLLGFFAAIALILWKAPLPHWIGDLANLLDIFDVLIPVIFFVGVWLLKAPRARTKFPAGEERRYGAKAYPMPRERATVGGFVRPTLMYLVRRPDIPVEQDRCRIAQVLFTIMLFAGLIIWVWVLWVPGIESVGRLIRLLLQLPIMFCMGILMLLLVPPITRLLLQSNPMNPMRDEDS